ARAVRARLRHLLHGRARPLVRPHAPALSARARPAARRSVRAHRPRDGRSDRRHLDLQRLRLAGGRTARRDRRIALDRRDPDLLLVLPHLYFGTASPLRAPSAPEGAPAAGELATLRSRTAVPDL